MIFFQYMKGFVSFLVILIVLAIMVSSSFYAGIKYSQSQISKQERTVIPTVQPQPKADAKETREDLIRRCGDIPDKAYPAKNPFEMRSSPEWAPDCRNIAWGIWQSGTSCPDCELRPTLTGREGIFLYNDTTKSVTKIYNPTKINETPEFVKWEDSQNLEFTTNSQTQKYNYNITTKKTSPLP